MVCVHPARHSSLALARDHRPTRRAGELSISSTPLSDNLSGELYLHILWGWAAGWGTWMARLRITAYAITLWCVMGNSASGHFVDFLAFARLLYIGSKGRARHRFISFLLWLACFFPRGYGTGHHLYLGLQSHGRQHLHRHLVAYQL